MRITTTSGEVYEAPDICDCHRGTASHSWKLIYRHSGLGLLYVEPSWGEVRTALKLTIPQIRVTKKVVVS